MSLPHYYSNKKSAARLASIQALYCALHHKDTIQLMQDKIIDDMYSIIKLYLTTQEDEDDDKQLLPNKQLFTKLITMTIAEHEQYDKIITQSLSENSSTKTTDYITLIILKVATCEMLHHKDTPFAVLINEYTKIAEYLTKESDVSFIHAMINTIKTKIDNNTA